VSRAPLLLAVACATPWDGPPCEPGPEPTLEVGKGEDAFESLADGTTPLVHGPQDGFHVYVNLRARYLDASAPWPVVITGTIDGVERARADTEVELACDEDGGALETEWATYLVWQLRGDALADKQCVLSVEATDAAGVKVTAVATARILYDGS
jgi:hypothetical protein